MKTKLMIPLVLIAGAVLGAVLMHVLQGPDPVAPGLLPEAPRHQFDAQHTAVVQRQNIPEWYEAVGTVRPRTESRIESLVTAQIREVLVDSGQRVVAGELLVRLDDRQLASRLAQARQAAKSAVAAREQAQQSVVAAEAALVQAETAFGRVKTLFDAQAATSQDLEAAESMFRQTRAGLERARNALAGADSAVQQADEGVREADIAMSYTRIEAPAAGEVLQRLADPGDLAVPGKPLLILQTSAQLMLEAYIREGLIGAVTPGLELSVHLSTIDQMVTARVDEIVPYADARSRTFLVKAALPALEQLYSGMFGKLLIPMQEHLVILIPSQAVRRIGQLEQVWVQAPHWHLRFIQTGRRLGDRVEVLSGLEGHETIGWRKDDDHV